MRDLERTLTADICMECRDIDMDMDTEGKVETPASMLKRKADAGKEREYTIIYSGL